MGVSYKSDMSRMQSDMRRMANEYRSQIVQANMLHEKGDNASIRKEAECCKRAAELTEKLANLSVGKEYEYWMERQEEVSKRFNEISEYALRRVRQINDNGDSSAPVPQGKQAEGAGTKAQKPQKRGGYEIPQEVIDKWSANPPQKGFEEVAGMEELIEKLRGCIRNVASTELNQYLGIDMVSSFFFYGPPGCGKTFISSAFICELMKEGYNYLSLSGGDIHNALVGESEKYVERAFAEAKAKAPCILFIDEIDSVCRNRSMPNIPSHAMSTTTAFLTGYNSLGDSKKPVIFIGATNYPNLVDNAMLDRVELIKLPLPDVKVRAKTFEMFFKPIMQNEPGFTYENMAEETYNYNQRDIKRLCIQIRDLVKKDVQSIYPDEHESVEALKSGSYTLSKEIFEKALKLYVPSRKDDIIRTLDEWDKDRERRSEE